MQTQCHLPWGRAELDASGYGHPADLCEQGTHQPVGIAEFCKSHRGLQRHHSFDPIPSQLGITSEAGQSTAAVSGDMGESLLESLQTDIALYVHQDLKMHPVGVARPTRSQFSIQSTSHSRPVSDWPPFSSRVSPSSVGFQVPLASTVAPQAVRVMATGILNPACRQSRCPWCLRRLRGHCW